MKRSEFIKKYLSDSWPSKQKYFNKMIEFWLYMPKNCMISIPYYSEAAGLGHELAENIPIANIYAEVFKNPKAKKGKEFVKLMELIKNEYIIED